MHPRWPWITLIALQGVQFLSLVPWLPMAGLAVMAFDAPGSDKLWQPWVFVVAIWSYPVWLLLAALAAWLLFVLHRYTLAVVLASIFTLPTLAALLFMLVMALGA